MGRKILAISAGVFLGALLIFLFEMMGHFIYPPPKELDLKQINQLQQFINHLPTLAFIIMLFSILIGCFFGGVLAKKIDRKNDFSAIIVGLIIMLIGLINNWQLEHPLWYTITSTLLCIPAAKFGAEIIPKKK